MPEPVAPTVEEWLKALGAAQVNEDCSTGKTTDEIAKILRVSRSTAQDRIKLLVDTGVLRCNPRGRPALMVTGVSRAIPTYYLVKND